MKRIRPTLILISLLCSACEKKPDRMTVEETRAETTKDRAPKLFATSDERFRNTKPSPVKGDPPQNWLALPASQFRELNYRFGDSGTGEVYVSLASGSVADNLNRWRGQFALAPLGGAELPELERYPIAGAEGVWVEADGEYASGMGQPARPGYGLAGLIAETGGRIITVKMVGQKAEVEAEKDALKAFAATLRIAE
jgi:hypothetical protein